MPIQLPSFNIAQPMYRTAILLITATLAQFVFTSVVWAVPHTGRRFEIMLLQDKIFAQGINNGTDDGLPFVRPYMNSIHDHWGNMGDGTAMATLPAFDLFDPQALVDHRLFLDFKGGYKWAQPPLMPQAGTTPVYTSLEPDELISVSFNGDTVDTDALGKLVLSESVDPHGFNDFDMMYSIGVEPTDSIYVLEWQLVSSNPNVETSDPIFTILSPDGTTPAARLHHASLYLEQHLGIASVPEPNSFAMLALVVTGVFARRRRGASFSA